jgi:hypothetical protein
MDYRITQNVWLIALCSLLGLSVSAQERVTTLGVQFKPMVPSKFFGTAGQEITNGEFTAQVDPRFGHNFGMVVRHGLTKVWSFETGISLVQRNFRMNWSVPGLDAQSSVNYRFVSYEIPVQALVYVRLGKQLWMNASGGMCIDMYPSDIASATSSRRDTVVYDFVQDTFRRRWIQISVLANYGFEWRSKESGFFYIGASFHRPFQEIAYTRTSVTINSNPSSAVLEMNGSYLTLDLRYFFHEDPERRRKQSK